MMTSTPFPSASVTLAARASVRRGALIVVEGVDRSGKSTQCATLVERLNTGASGTPSALAMRFPDRTTDTGRLIDAYLQGHGNAGLDDRTIHLLFAANRAEAMGVLKANLLAGTTVVIDRYAFSGVAYTHAKNAPGLDVEWCKSVDAGILKPDLVLFLDIPPKDASLRGEYGSERYEKLGFQEKVRECFMELVDKEYWKVLDARQSKESLADEILRIASSKILNVGETPLHQLWM